MSSVSCLSGLFESTDVEFDLNARIVPKNQGRARDELQRVADDLRTDASLEDSVRGSYLHERADTAVATYKAVENGQRVFDQEPEEMAAIENEHAGTADDTEEDGT